MRFARSIFRGLSTLAVIGATLMCLALTPDTLASAAPMSCCPGMKHCPAMPPPPAEVTCVSCLRNLIVTKQSVTLDAPREIAKASAFPLIPISRLTPHLADAPSPISPATLLDLGCSLRC